ncbi:extracellular solute-binding protein [Porcincola intestinalis]|uniref:Extracellular solute-binding protein n=1 Tax=Porcincola intestinalis TaxID=2606632 RepID=A0A6L5X3J2_9FIRM|nr:extracellular solute-binding protein [Porcincola intestinalis]MSS13943.1 extracellular solute-binding protein [Porcincola intestinalis]
MRNRKIATLISAGTLIFSMLAGAGSAAADEKKAGENLFNLDGTLPIVKDASSMDPITIAYVSPPEKTVAVAEMPMTKKIFDETGIPVEWIEIPSDGATEKINLMLNGGDYPDVFWNGISSDMAIQYSDQDIFIPTEDLIQQYCPRLMDIFEKRPEYRKGSVAPNGHSYGFPYVEEMYGLVKTPGPFLINKNWLDKVGKKVPTTVDEWVDCLKAFRDGGDLNGNGVADEVPYSFGMGCDGLFNSYDTFNYFTGCFGSADSVCSANAQANHLRIVDGKIHFTAADDAFRKTANFFNKLYSENLIDMDSFSPGPNADTPLYISKMSGDEAVIGCLGTWAPVNEIVNPKVRSQYVAIPRLTGEDGKGGVEVNYSEMAETSMVAITNKCKYPEVIAALVNYCMDPEISVTLNWGPEGYTYVKGDDGVLHFNLDKDGNIILKNGYQSFTEQRANTTPGRGSLVVLSDYYGKVADYTWDAIDLLQGQKENGKEEIMEDIDAVPKMMLTLEEQQTIARIYPQVANVVDTFQMNAILQGGADNLWDQYLNDLKSAGVDELVDTYQGAYERFSAS